MWLSVADYVIQATLVLLAFVLPWFLSCDRTTTAAFAYPFFVATAWGIWRMCYFDPATKNDVPGIGYFIAAFILGIIGLLIFGLRQIFIRRKN